MNSGEGKGTFGHMTSIECQILTREPSEMFSQSLQSLTDRHSVGSAEDDVSWVTAVNNPADSSLIHVEELVQEDVTGQSQLTMRTTADCVDAPKILVSELSQYRNTNLANRRHPSSSSQQRPVTP